MASTYEDTIKFVAANLKKASNIEVSELSEVAGDPGRRRVGPRRTITITYLRDDRG